MKKRFFAALVLAGILAASAAMASPCDEDRHPFGGWITHREPTCTMVGDQIRYCRGCDHWENRDIPKLPHTPDEWVLTKEPTCTTDGRMNAKCTVCHGNIKKTLPKLGHDWEVTYAKVEPTCKKAGEGEMTCTRCGKVKKGKLDKLEHVWGEMVVTKEPSGKNKGTREAVCELCGDVKKEHFFNDGTLFEGMTPCPEVIAMQQMLTDLGYYKGSISTGTFGSITGKAVAKFQKTYKLKSTEVADEETLDKLKEVWESKTGRSVDEIWPSHEDEETGDEESEGVEA